ncbi:MAG TPA: FHA domain-containing protein [Kofleriaceae bacterium]|jgi:pSer/pThr/pTyr-binding forkhead associated (FHA) protein/RNA polymerase subunit RPABC4/transcription elongation factor Spt4
MDVGLVCDACSALTPIGVPQCARCGQPVALDPRPRRRSAQPPNEPAAATNGSAKAAIACSKCSTPVPPTMKFCPTCGAKVVAPAPQDFEGIQTRVGPRQPPAAAQKPGRSTLFFGGALQAARAKLTLIRGDGEDGVSFTLAGTDHLAGRGECPISFPDDSFLSPIHANFRYFNNQLVVRDEDSLNGVFVRITDTIKIQSGTTLLVGEQVLVVNAAKLPDDVPDGEGTYYSASMMRSATIELVQQLRGGSTGSVYRPDAASVTLGREANDINFADDPFISGRHAQVRIEGGVLSVTDLGSRNGTFVRIAGEQPLRHGDYVFLGQQLLRVEIV